MLHKQQTIVTVWWFQQFDYRVCYKTNFKQLTSIQRSVWFGYCHKQTLMFSKQCTLKADWYIVSSLYYSFTFYNVCFEKRKKNHLFETTYFYLSLCDSTSHRAVVYWPSLKNFKINLRRPTKRTNKFIIKVYLAVPLSVKM